MVNSSVFALTELEVFYFEPAHTFMSADSIHHQVDQSLKAQKKTYDFDDFCKAVGNDCKGNIEDVQMKTKTFFEWTSFKSEKKIKDMEESVHLANIVQLKAVRGELSVQYELTLCGIVVHVVHYLITVPCCTVVQKLHYLFFFFYKMCAECVFLEMVPKYSDGCQEQPDT